MSTPANEKPTLLEAIIECRLDPQTISVAEANEVWDWAESSKDPLANVYLTLCDALAQYQNVSYKIRKKARRARYISTEEADAIESMIGMSKDAVGHMILKVIKQREKLGRQPANII